MVLTDEEYARMTQMARARERSMSWLGRYAVRRLLDEYEGGQLPLQLDIPER
jgi:predicted transcriptional regulator